MKVTLTFEVSDGDLEDAVRAAIDSGEISLDPSEADEVEVSA